MGMRAHRLGSVRHRRGEAARGEQRHIGQVVPDVRALLGREPEIGAQPLPRGELVVRVRHEVRDAQLLRAVRDGRRRAAGDPGDDDACARQHVEPDAVERGERLELVAVIVDVDAPVGEHAVDVARQQAHATRAGSEIGVHRVKS